MSRVLCRSGVRGLLRYWRVCDAGQIGRKVVMYPNAAKRFGLLEGANPEPAGLASSPFGSKVWLRVVIGPERIGTLAQWPWQRRRAGLLHPTDWPMRSGSRHDRPGSRRGVRPVAHVGRRCAL